MTVNMALIHDGVKLLAEGFKHTKLYSTSLSCKDESSWEKGLTVVNIMKSVSF